MTEVYPRWAGAPARFNAQLADLAHKQWGSNCGPGALAGISNLTLDEVRPHMGDFEQKGYTNPTLMFDCLRSVCAARVIVGWRKRRDKEWPGYGLARIQWEGPWTLPGVPPRARYRHTHWVGFQRIADESWCFDINAISVGGWITLKEWRQHLVPWLLRECEPQASGCWHVTHSIEIERAA